MPIMTESYSDPRWGFLHGLGASPSDVLYGALLTQFKTEISTLAAKTGLAIKQFTSQVYVPVTSAQRAILENLQNQRVTLQSWMDTVEEAVRNGTIGGQPITGEKAAKLSEMAGKLVNNYADGVQAMAQYSPTSILKNALVSVASDLAQIANALFDLARKIIKALADVGGGVADTVGLLKYLPYVVVGGAVLFFVVPAVLRYRREGEAGLEAELRAGAGAVGRGAKAAGRGLVRAGRAGVALYTGNPAIAGVRRRR